MRSIIEELLTKECESYQLIKFDLLPSVEYGINLLLPLYPDKQKFYFTDAESYTLWREKALTVFYEKINYVGFLEREQNSFSFKRFFNNLKKNVVSNYRTIYAEATIDKELVVDKRDTLAFKLSTMIASEQYEAEREQLLTCKQPAEIEKLYRKKAKHYYPIDLSEFLNHLKRDDHEFWTVLYPLIEVMVFYKKKNYPFDEDEVQNIVGGTLSVVREKLGEKDFESALHFKNYIGKIALYNCQSEWAKANKNVELVNIDKAYLLEEGLTNDMDMHFLYKIDADSMYDVSRAVAFVLYYETEPFYSQLIEGQEERVEILLWQLVEDLSYKEIALKLNKQPTTKELNNLRQMASRVKQPLLERFKGLLNEYKPYRI